MRGLSGIKEASVDINGSIVNIAVASGLGNARKLLEDVKEDRSKYHLIEIMACPGGCIDGGGQPFIKGDTSIIRKRMAAIYDIDAKKIIRKSHENPEVIQLYDEFLGEPYGEKAHHLLHTGFVQRNAF